MNCFLLQVEKFLLIGLKTDQSTCWKRKRRQTKFQYSKINVRKAHQLVTQLLKWFNKWFEARLNFNHG